MNKSNLINGRAQLGYSMDKLQQAMSNLEEAMKVMPDQRFDYLDEARLCIDRAMQVCRMADFQLGSLLIDLEIQQHTEQDPNEPLFDGIDRIGPELG